MTTLVQDQLALNQTSGIVEMFVLDTTNWGGSVLRFTNSKTDVGYITHNSLQYYWLPCELTGLTTGTSGTLPQPTLNVSVAGNTLLRAAITAYGDLAACKLTYFKTYEKYLDGRPGADAAAITPPEVFILSQLVGFTNIQASWRLVTPLDRPNVLIPRLQYLKDAAGENIYAPGLTRVYTNG